MSRETLKVLCVGLACFGVGLLVRWYPWVVNPSRAPSIAWSTSTSSSVFVPLTPSATCTDFVWFGQRQELLRLDCETGHITWHGDDPTLAARAFWDFVEMSQPTRYETPQRVLQKLPR